MKKAKIILSVVATLLVLILPFLSVVTFIMATPPQYSASFTGALNEKYDRLCSIKENKIVVVGGSSVAFGLDSAALEEYTGMPVVNFGLYAALGTKLMLDLSEDGIKKGDVVVIAPELDPQTLSMYFNSRTTLEALDDDYSMMLDVGFDNWFNLFGGMWSFAGDKLALMLSDVPPVPDVRYNSANINEYGDYSGERKENVMAYWYDKNTPINLTPDMLGDGFSEFADYLNGYITRLKLKGAEVYFSFCPMNEMALTVGTTAESKAALVELLKESINCEFISDIDDYILEAGYFFDTNFHLNDAGVKVRTARLAKDLKLSSFAVTGGIIPDEPHAPALPGADILYMGYDENEKYFTYELIDEGTYKGAYAISGLSELGKTQTELTVPVGAEGLQVIFAYEGAFSGGVVKRLNITADTNLEQFMNGAFFDSGINQIYFYSKTFSLIVPPADFVGADLKNLKVHIPEGMNESGLYEWSQRGLDFVYDVKVKSEV